MFDSAYRSLQHFGLNYSPLDADQVKNNTSENALVELSRYLAAVVAFWAVILLIGSTIYDSWLLHKQTAEWNVHRRIVLLGFGSMNTALARVLSRHGVYLTVIAKEFSVSDRQFARDHAILLVEGDLAEWSTLKRAKVGKSTRIVVAAGGDATNVEIGTTAAGFVEAEQRRIENIENQFRRCGEPKTQRGYACDQRGDPVTQIHLTSVRTLADLSEARDIAYARGAAADFFSIKTEAARQLMRKARLPLRAFESGQDRVHVVIVGMGDQGEAILNEVLLSCWSANLNNQPRITVIENAPVKNTVARLGAHRPRLMDPPEPNLPKPEIKVLELDAIAVDFGAATVLAKIETAGAPTAWVFTCGDDEVNLAAALRLEMAMRQGRRLPAPIYMRLWNADIDKSGAATDSSFVIESRNPLLFSQVFGSITTVLPESGIVRNLLRACGEDASGSDIEHFAKLLHHEYLADVDREAALGAIASEASVSERQAYAEAIERFTTEWAALPSGVKEGNRRAVRHFATKLMDLGFRWQGMDNEWLPAFDRTIAKKWLEAIAAKPVADSFGASPPETLERRLFESARAEHERWIADRLLEGWSHGDRDNRARTHPNLVPFKELEEQKRPYDLTALRLLFDHAGHRANAPRAHEKASVEIRIETADAVTWPDLAALDAANEIVVYLAKGAEIRLADGARETLLSRVETWAAKDNAVRLRVDVERTPGVGELQKLGKDYTHTGKVVSGLADIAARNRVVMDVLWDEKPEIRDAQSVRRSRKRENSA